MLRTAQANVGTLPYAAIFDDGTDSGWIRYGGDWSAASGKLVESSGGANGPKAFAGSTAWTNYTASAEITQDTAGGDAGLIEAFDLPVCQGQCGLMNTCVTPRSAHTCLMECL